MDQSVSSTPALADGLAYFGDWSGTLYAVDTETGDVRWRSEEPGGRIDSSPAVADGVVYAGDNWGYLHALDAQTGNHRWKFETDVAVHTGPLVTHDTVSFGNNDNHAYAVERDR